MMLTPSEFIESYALTGEKKTKAATLKLFMLAILAGFFIGLGGAVTNIASSTISNPSVTKIVNGMLFPFGLIMVLLTGSELFTGNCLITISLLEKRATFLGMLRNLFIVYIGNFVGAVLLAYACVYSGQISFSISATFKTAAAKCSLNFSNAIIFGILCNILVCVGVMCGLCGKSITGRSVGAYIPIAFFVICGFEHCIANMYYIPAGLFAKIIPEYLEAATKNGINLTNLTWKNFLVCNLLPVTIGNIIGGCIFSALIWAGHSKKKEYHQ